MCKIEVACPTEEGDSTHNSSQQVRDVGNLIGQKKIGTECIQDEQSKPGVNEMATYKDEENDQQRTAGHLFSDDIQVIEPHASLSLTAPYSLLSMRFCMSSFNSSTE